MELLRDPALEQSSVVANSLMNRERHCVGDNSYEKELALNPIEFLRGRLNAEAHVAWLDLCCGRGRALIEAAQAFDNDNDRERLSFVGVDLVSMFDPRPAQLRSLQLVEASAFQWVPQEKFDLVTCVHGLHYIGNKLGLIAQACAWLKPDGLFVGHLDLANIKVTNDAAGKRLLRDLWRAGLIYDEATRVMRCNGARQITLKYEYSGANDHAGPNYTGQAAVDSYYHRAQ
jgi:SAM-dependent methyltransferase